MSGRAQRRMMMGRVVAGTEEVSERWQMTPGVVCSRTYLRGLRWKEMEGGTHVQ